MEFFAFYKYKLSNNEELGPTCSFQTAVANQTTISDLQCNYPGTLSEWSVASMQQMKISDNTVCLNKSDSNNFDPNLPDNDYPDTQNVENKLPKNSNPWSDPTSSGNPDTSDNINTENVHTLSQTIYPLRDPLNSEQFSQTEQIKDEEIPTAEVVQIKQEVTETPTTALYQSHHSSDVETATNSSGQNLLLSLQTMGMFTDSTANTTNNNLSDERSQNSQQIGLPRYACSINKEGTLIF